MTTHIAICSSVGLMVTTHVTMFPAIVSSFGDIRDRKFNNVGLLLARASFRHIFMLCNDWLRFNSLDSHMITFATLPMVVSFSSLLLTTNFISHVMLMYIDISIDR